jgi:hypothetical protein
MGVAREEASPLHQQADHEHPVRPASLLRQVGGRHQRDGQGQARLPGQVRQEGHDGRVGRQRAPPGWRKLRIIVKAPANDDNGRLTYKPANWQELVDVAGYRTFRQAAWAGSYEGQTTIGLGVRAKLPMRVFVLNDADGRRRVVVDVAHRWY